MFHWDYWNAHAWFITFKNASEKKFVAIAAWGNTKVIIRRKQGYEELTTVEADDIIAEDQPTKFVIEITTGTVTIESNVNNICYFVLYNF